MGRLLAMFVISLTAIKKSARAAQFDSAATLTNVRVHHFMLQDRFTAFPLRFVLTKECWPLFAILPYVKIQCRKSCDVCDATIEREKKRAQSDSFLHFYAYGLNGGM